MPPTTNNEHNTPSGLTLLHKSHKILEKGHMELRPFGNQLSGETIQDVSGITVKANVEYLAELVARSRGPDAGKAVLQELVESLNARIPDSSYHVTPEFLTNPWHGYSYEFVMYLAEFSVLLSQDPEFHRKLGREKLLSPIIQLLGRPFSIPQIFKMFPHFVEKFTKGALQPEVVSVSPTTAILRLQLSAHTRRQFGPYLQSCAERLCQSGRAALTSIPSSMFHLPAARVTEPCCMADGADYCEWHFTWKPPHGKPWAKFAISFGLGLAIFGSLSWSMPDLSHLHKIGYSILSGLLFWIGTLIWTTRKAFTQQQAVIQEQLNSVEAQHEELRRAYATQEQTAIELHHHVRELTMFHNIAVRLSSTLDQKAVIKAGLEAVTQDLHFDRVMISLFDTTTRVAWKAQIMGGSDTLSDFVQSLEIPITESESLEGQILLCGRSIFITNTAEVRDHMHPLNTQLLDELKVQAFIGIPLKFQDTILGALLADRSRAIPLVEDDVRTLTTVGHHIALALHNAQSFSALGKLNESLELKVQERTFDIERTNQQLETANTRLQEFDRMKSQFLSHCSHELRTPLASIKGFSENLLEGFAGNLNSKQEMAIRRINANSNRLTRLISDLLDLSQIEAGRLRLHLTRVNLRAVAEEVVEHLQPLLAAKNQHVHIHTPQSEFIIMADRDRVTQILLNLIHNAGKFTPDGESINIIISSQREGWASISITDPGPGIPENALSHLFDPFFQAHRDQEIGSKGLGLGLAIVKHLVELHHGTITVDSRPHHGTTFRMTFPNSQPLV